VDNVKARAQTDILFGKVAVELGLIDPGVIQQAAELQENRYPDEPIGEVLIKEGLLTVENLKNILEAQIGKFNELDPDSRLKKEDFIFGRIVVKNKLAAEKQLNECLREQARLAYHGKFVRIGTILVEKGILGPELVRKVLAIQRKTILICEKCLSQYNISNYAPGKKYRCTKCSSILIIPERIETAEVAASIRSLSDIKSPRSDSEFAETKVLDRDGTDPFIGKVIGGCRIETRLGAGGMGTVYRATQLALDKTRAVKILPPAFAEEEAYIERFNREAKNAAQIEHNNVMKIIDFGVQDGTYYIVMEYIDGISLSRFLQEKGPLPENVALDIARQAASGLAAAAKLKIIHRDIKPDNIMLVPSEVDGNYVVKITDFGLAKNTRETASLTQGRVMGTIPFMSPEQCKGEEADHRSDLYSLGITIYAMLTGETPFDAENPHSILLLHISEPPVQPRKLNPKVSRATNALILKLLQKEKENRHQSAAELVDDITEIATGGVPMIQGLSQKSRKKIYIPVAAAIVIAVIIIFIFAGRRGDNGPASPGDAGRRADLQKMKAINELFETMKTSFRNRRFEQAADTLRVLRDIYGSEKQEEIAKLVSEVEKYYSENKSRWEDFHAAKSRAKSSIASGALRKALESYNNAQTFFRKDTHLIAELKNSITQLKKEMRTRYLGLRDTAIAFERDGKWAKALGKWRGAEKTAPSTGDFEFCKRKITSAAKEVENANRFRSLLASAREAIAGRDWEKAALSVNKLKTFGPESAEVKELAMRVRVEEMIKIPGGTFAMGGKSGSADEAPVHQVSLNDYYIDKYEVTNIQFKVFLENEDGYNKRKYWSPEGWRWRLTNEIEKPACWDDPDYDKPYQPVVGISWYEASAYSKWASKRLPTEAEWEYAAKGTNKNKWPWGNSFNPAGCNSREKEEGKPVEVGSFSKGVSPFGCHDMAGNVWEWCLDWYSEDYYREKFQVNPAGPSRGTEKVARGGSWFNAADNLRTTNRLGLDLENRDDETGFRCVRGK